MRQRSRMPELAFEYRRGRCGSARLVKAFVALIQMANNKENIAITQASPH